MKHYAFLVTCCIIGNLQAAQISQSKDRVFEMWQAIGSCNTEKLADVLPSISHDDINKSLPHGMSPLTMAIEQRDKPIVQLLIEHGANVDLPDGDGNIPLEAAVNSNDIELVQLLINNKVDINKADAKGLTVLFYAHSREMAQYLLNSGITSNTTGTELLIKAVVWQWRELATFLIIYPFPINTPSLDDGRTALMWAMVRNHPDMIRLLVSGGADLEIRNAQDSNRKAIDYAGRNKKALQRAIKEGQRELAYYQQQRKLAEEQTEIIPVLTSIIQDYTFGEVPENLHAQEPEKNSWCTIQ